MVGTTGLEPVISCMSNKYSAAELSALVVGQGGFEPPKYE